VRRKGATERPAQTGAQRGGRACGPAAGAAGAAAAPPGSVLAPPARGARPGGLRQRALCRRRQRYERRVTGRALERRAPRAVLQAGGPRGAGSQGGIRVQVCATGARGAPRTVFQAGGVRGARCCTHEAGRGVVLGECGHWQGAAELSGAFTAKIYKRPGAACAGGLVHRAAPAGAADGGQQGVWGAPHAGQPSGPDSSARRRGHRGTPPGGSCSERRGRGVGA
jgi:hypothetical protein